MCVYVYVCVRVCACVCVRVCAFICVHPHVRMATGCLFVFYAQQTEHVSCCQHFLAQQASLSMHVRQPFYAQQATILCTAGNHSMHSRQPFYAQQATFLCTAGNHPMHGRQPSYARHATFLCTAGNLSMHSRQPFYAQQATILCIAGNHSMHGRQPSYAQQATFLCTADRKCQTFVLTWLTVKDTIALSMNTPQIRLNSHHCTLMRTWVHTQVH